MCRGRGEREVACVEGAGCTHKAASASHVASFTEAADRTRAMHEFTEARGNPGNVSGGRAHWHRTPCMHRGCILSTPRGQLGLHPPGPGLDEGTKGFLLLCACVDRDARNGKATEEKAATAPNPVSVVVAVVAYLVHSASG